MNADPLIYVAPVPQVPEPNRAERRGRKIREGKKQVHATKGVIRAMIQEKKP